MLQKSKVWISIVCTLASIFILMSDGNREAHIRNKQIATPYVEGVEKEKSVNTDNVDEKDTADISKAVNIILTYGTKDLFKGYLIDESFLCWIAGNYGEDVIFDLAYEVYQGKSDYKLWKKLIGKSIHSLWLTYCKDLNYDTVSWEDIIWSDEDKGNITIDFTGDINFDKDWYTMKSLKKSQRGIRECISSEIKDELDKADISVVNNEFTFGTNGKALAGKDYTFRAEPESVDLLEHLSADIVNLGNNHVYDYGEIGLVNTLDILHLNNYKTIGAGKDLDEATRIQYAMIKGKKIAFVSATEIEKYSNYTKQATPNSAGVLKTLNTTKFKRVIKEAKTNSDYVIAYVHWGFEGLIRNDSGQKNLATQFIDAGADAVIGCHPHRLQGVEFIKGKPVVYSLGNFWFSTGTLYTTIAQIIIDEKGKLSLRMIPCIQNNMKTSILSEKKEVRDFYRYIADVSNNVGIEENGIFHNIKRLNKKYKYMSGQGYAKHDGMKDLKGRTIDKIGNIK